MELTAFWMMFFDGYIGAPPTITVLSLDISLFILSLATAGAMAVAVNASAPSAAADRNAIRFDMETLPMNLRSPTDIRGRD